MTQKEQTDISYLTMVSKEKAWPQSLFFYVACIAGVDFFAILLCFSIPWIFRIGIYSQPFSLGYLVAIILFEAIYFFLCFSEDAYNETVFRRTRQSLVIALKAIVLSFGALLLVAFIFKVTSEFSRVWGVTWFALLILYFVLSRFYITRLMSRLANKGIVASRSIVVGDVEKASSLIRSIISESATNTTVAAFFNTARPSEISGGGQEILAFMRLSGIRIFEGFDDLEDQIPAMDVDDVIIASSWTNADLINDVIKKSSQKSTNIFLAPEAIIPSATGRFRQFGSLTLFELACKPIDRWYGFAKRAEDVVLSLLALLLLCPVMIGVAIAIKLESKGPAFFRQDRYGFNNELIKVLKFRSMYSEQTDGNAEKLASRNDPRVTKVGRFIRKTSIDELPQLFNVLIGNMSLVGPRPHAIKAKAAGKLYQEVVESYAKRHQVKPGITGWAQVNGWRGETDTEVKILKRIEKDLYYIQNWSFSFDMFILLKTIYVVLFDKENAY